MTSNKYIPNGVKKQIMRLMSNMHWKVLKNHMMVESNTMQLKKLELKIYLPNFVHFLKLILHLRLNYPNSKKSSLVTLIIMLFALVMGGLELMLLI